MLNRRAAFTIATKLQHRLVSLKPALAEDGFEYSSSEGPTMRAWHHPETLTAVGLGVASALVVGNVLLHERDDPADPSKNNGPTALH
jgi:hypothetical protein